jgi:hypothetical protein
MKSYLLTLSLLFFACFIPKEISYKINLKTGILDITYLDFCSDAKNDTSLSMDYRKLINTYDSADISLNNNRFKLLSKKLYQRKHTLNGNLTIQVKQIDSIQGLINIVKEFLFDDIKLKYVSRKIYLENTNKKVFNIYKSNSRLINSPNSQSAVWNKNDYLLRFNISIKDDAFKKSLSIYYLKDNSF